VKISFTAGMIRTSGTACQETSMRMPGLIAVALLSGCASQPHTAAPAPAAKAAVAKDAPAATLAAVKEGEKKEFVAPPGYKERLEDGKRYYCTKVVVLGSRFPKEDCRTQAELEEIEVAKGALRGTLSQRQGICSSAGGCVTP